MGNLEGNSETWKTLGFSGFKCLVSGIGRVLIFGFGLGSGSKKVGLFPRVSGFWVQRPITTLASNNSTQKIRAFISSIFSNGFSSNQKKQAWECLSSIGGTIHKMMQKISNPFFKEWYG